MKVSIRLYLTCAEGPDCRWVGPVLRLQRENGCTGSVICRSCHMPMTELAIMRRSDHSMNPRYPWSAPPRQKFRPPPGPRKPAKPFSKRRRPIEDGRVLTGINYGTPLAPILRRLNKVGEGKFRVCPISSAAHSTGPNLPFRKKGHNHKPLPADSLSPIWLL